MESQSNENSRPVNPRRRKRTKSETFREVYLPFLLLAIGVLLIVGIIAGVASHVSNSHTPDTTTGSNSAKLDKKAKELLNQADALAADYDYDGALALLENAKDELKELPKIRDAIESYTIAKNNLVVWRADQVTDLSFHVLIADMEAALADKTYGKNGDGQYNQNFITTDEFSAILQQLFDGGYVLVDLDDLYSYDAETQTYIQKELRLPAGKKPLMLTETHCNYYRYMQSSRAFATKLLYGKDGFYNEMTNSAGETVTGNFDLVPILEAFIRENPTFSYRGARAVLAFSGYDGIFGYRITSDDLSSEALAQECADASALVQALRDSGYTLACYTYGNINYSKADASDIRSDIQKWQKKIVPVLGQTDILVYARGGDIGTDYAKNEKFNVLHSAGFRYFLGSSNIHFSEVKESYVRHNRLLVTGSSLAHHSDLFKDILDTTELLDSCRGNIPQ